MSVRGRSTGCVGGLYEVLVGVPDLGEAERAFAAYGCRPGARGSLGAPAARALYGVDSAVRSVRLLHGRADHGLVRLMQWDQPRNAGLGVAPNLRCVGSRWGVRLTSSVMNLMNHAERSRARGDPISVLPPQLAVIGEVSGERIARPFLDPIVGVREMVVLQPLMRQVFFERFGYASPRYGRIDEASLLRTSQHTHFGLMIADDDAHVLDFYEEALGLLRWMDAWTPYENTSGSRTIFGLEPGEGFHMVDFDDPRSGQSLEARRSGKLKCVRFARGARIEHALDRSRAGCLGYGSYVWRARGLAGLRRRVGAAGGRDVTDLLADEFGSRAFGFVAPDGYHWILREA